ncbi:MAG: protein kinase [Acidobacteria bacterium]|nr:protein kinase [Acidobacteriota bacterium]
MTPEQYRQIEGIYHEALSLNIQQRREFLAKVCSDDEAVRREVESLLAAQEGMSGFLTQPNFSWRDEREGVSSEEETQRFTRLQIERYRVLSPLGAGGMGEVYAAEDTRLHRPVALKLLPARFTWDTERVRRFEQEAMAASALNHPNIITVYDMGETPEGRFIAMELVQGRTLRKLSEEPLSTAQLCLVGKQIAEALAVAHAAGITHRDIKPENIMVRDDGYVKVLDFGLARLSSESVAAKVDTGSGIVMGTVRYMSPEQARGERVSQASDMFSLGIVLYELAAGCHPFNAETQLGFLRAIIEQEVLSVTRFNADIPSHLDSLILSLLAKDAERRPNAAETATALQQMESPRSSEIEKSESRLRPLAPRPPVVGREREREALRTAFDQVERGRGLMLCITGEPGIGKTTVVEEFLAELGSRPHRIARGRCSERLAGTEAYLPFWETLESLLRGDANGVLAHTMKRLAPTWYAQIAPDLNTASAVQLAENKAPSQERLKRELIVLFQEIAKRQALILFFDDLHWADVSTVDLLAYLASQFDETRVLVIITYRPSELLISKHPFQKVKLDLQGRGVCREMPLGFLSRAEVESYLGLLFPNHHFPVDFAALIYAKTEGNPLFMADLVRYLRDHQVINEREGRWELARALPDIERELPESVRGMVERKIAQLSEGDHKLLTGASVQGYEFDSAVIAKSLGLDAADVEDQLGVLEHVHSFIRQVDEREFPDGTPSLRFRFVHVLYQNALYAGLRPTRRASLSGAVAQALMGFYGPERSAEVAPRLAFLFETARDFARAADYFLLASQGAFQVFANQEAATLAERGLEMLKTLPESSERDQKELALQMSLGLSLTPIRGFVGLEVGQAYSRARELCQKMGENPSLILVLFGLWLFHVIRAEHSIADELANQLLRLAQLTQDRTLVLRMHFVRGFSSDYMGDPQTASSHYKIALEHYHPQQQREQILQFGSDYGLIALSRQSWTLLALGYAEQARLMLEKCLDTCRKVAHPFSVCNALLSLPQIYIELGEPQNAQQIAEEAVFIATEHGFPLNYAYASLHRGYASARQGRLTDGIAEMQQNFERLRAIGTEMSLNGYSVDLAEVLGLAGRIEEGLAVVNEAIVRASKSGECYFEAESYRVKADLLVQQAAGQLDRASSTDSGIADAQSILNEAATNYQQAITLAHRRGTLLHELRATVGLCRVWQRQEKSGQARTLLTEVYRRFTEGFDTPDLQCAKALLDQISAEVET